MRFRGTKKIKILGKIEFGGWDVLLGGAVALFIVGGLLPEERFLFFVGVGLIVLWLVMTFLVNLGIVKKTPPAEGSGGANGLPSDSQRTSEVRPKKG